MQRYPKYSVREIEKVWDRGNPEQFFDRIKDKKRVEEILNGTCNAELGKSKKKKESTR